MSQGSEKKPIVTQHVKTVNNLNKPFSLRTLHQKNVMDKWYKTNCSISQLTSLVKCTFKVILSDLEYCLSLKLLEYLQHSWTKTTLIHIMVASTAQL